MYYLSCQLQYRIHVIRGKMVLYEAAIKIIGCAPSRGEKAAAAVVTPGLVDAHSVVGLSGYLNQEQDQDQIEMSTAIQPDLRAIDAYNPRERLVEYLRNLGVTTLHTGHAPGPLVATATPTLPVARE